MGQEQSVSSRRRRSTRKETDDNNDANNSDKEFANSDDVNSCQKGENDDRRLSIGTNSSKSNKKHKVHQHDISTKRRESEHKEFQSKKEKIAKERRLSHHRRESTNNSDKERKYTTHHSDRYDKASNLYSTSSKTCSKNNNYNKNIFEVKEMRQLNCNNNQAELPVNQHTINVHPEEVMCRDNKMSAIPSKEFAYPACTLQTDIFVNARQQVCNPAAATNSRSVKVNNDSNVNCCAMSATETLLPCSRSQQGCNRILITNAGRPNLSYNTIPNKPFHNTSKNYQVKNIVEDNTVATNNIRDMIDSNSNNRNKVNRENYNYSSVINNYTENKKECFQQPFQSSQLTISPVTTQVLEENADTAHLTKQPNLLHPASLPNISQDQLSNSVRRKRVNSVVTVTDNSVILTDNNKAVPPYLSPLPPPRRLSIEVREQTNTLNTSGKNVNEMIGKSTLENKKVVNYNDDRLVKNNIYCNNNNYNNRNLNALELPTLVVTKANNQFALSSTKGSLSTLNIPHYINKEQQFHVANKTVEQQQQQQQQHLMSDGVRAPKISNSNCVSIAERTQQPQRQQEEIIKSQYVEPKGILNRKSSYSNIRRQSFCAGREFVEDDKDIAERLAKRGEVLSAYQTLPGEEVVMRTQNELAEAQIHATARVRANDYTNNNLQEYAENVNSSFVSQELYEEQQPEPQPKQQQQEIADKQRFLSEVDMHTLGQQPLRYVEKHLPQDYARNFSDRSSRINNNLINVNKTGKVVSVKRYNNVDGSSSIDYTTLQQSKELSKHINKININDHDVLSNDNEDNYKNVDITRKEESQSHIPMLVLYELPLRFRRSSVLASSGKANSINDTSTYPVKTYGEDCTEIKVCTNLDSSESNTYTTAFKVDELIAHRRASTAIDSVLVNNIKSCFVNGYPTCLFGLDSPSLVENMSALESPSSLLIEKLILDVINDMKEGQCSTTKAESELREEEKLQPEHCKKCELYCAIIAVVCIDMQHTSNTYVDLLATCKCEDKDQSGEEAMEIFVWNKEENNKSVLDKEKELGSCEEETSIRQYSGKLPELHFTSVESIGLQLDNVTYRKIDDEETFASIFSEAQTKANEFVNAYKDKYSSIAQNEIADHHECCYYYVISCIRVQGGEKLLREMRETMKNVCSVNNGVVTDHNDNYSNDERRNYELLMEKLSCLTANASNIDSTQEKYQTIVNSNVLEKPKLSLHIADNEVVLSTLTCVTVDDRGYCYDEALTKAREMIMHRYRQENLYSTTWDNESFANSKLNISETDLLTELFTMPWYGVSVAGIDPRNSDAVNALNVQHELAYNKEFIVLSKQGLVKQKCSELLSELEVLNKEISKNGCNNKSHILQLINRKRSELCAISKLLCTK